MNLDRPLDDLVKESLAAKRVERTEKRKTARQKRVQTRKTSNINNSNNQNNQSNQAPANGTTDPADSNMDVGARKDKLNLRRRGAGIGKKRRQRKKSLGDMEVDTGRKPSPPNGLPADGPNVITSYPRGKAVKVVVSNLHPQVTQTDIAELFETVGPLKSAHLNRYPNGASACEAEVVFENMPDALEAIKRYNLVPLDNQPLQITLVTTKTTKTRRAPQKKNGGMQVDDGFRSPENEKANGFEDRSPERAPQRRRPGRRRRYNRGDDRRPDERRQDDRRQDDRRQEDRRQEDRRQEDRRQEDRRADDRRADDRHPDDRHPDDRRPDDRRTDDRRPDDRRDDRQDRDRDMYVD